MLPRPLRIIGVISDTHGLVRGEALAALRGVDLILHAGDIGSAHVLEELRAIAPVIAVRGNNDKDTWADNLPETEVVEIGKTLIYLLHDIHEIDLNPAAAGFSAVISGHSHKPIIDRRNGVLFLNPGSAGPRRFKLPVSVARIALSESAVEGELITLDV